MKFKIEKTLIFVDFQKYIFFDFTETLLRMKFLFFENKYIKQNYNSLKSPISKIEIGTNLKWLDYWLKNQASTIM